MVVLWDSLTDEGKKECLEELRTTNDWVIWRKDSRKEDEDLMSYLMKVGSSEAELYEDRKNRKECLVKRCVHARNRLSFVQGVGERKIEPM